MESAIRAWSNRLARAVLFSIALLGLVALVLLAFGLPVGESFRLLVQGSLVGPFSLARTAVKATPLLCTALGMVVAWRGGMFNIGGEGQFVMGGLLAATAAPVVQHWPALVAVPTLTALCMLGGSLYALIPAYLFVSRNVQVVISTILLNFIALYVLEWAVQGPLQRAKRDIPQSERLPESHMFFQPNPQLDFHAGIVVAVLAAIFVGWVLSRTVLGFRVRLLGENPRLADLNGYSVSRYRYLVMAVSGALCGLAASCQYLGVAGAIDKGFSQQWGFLGIPVALLGDLTASGALIASVFFGALFAGSENLARFTPGSATMIYAIQAAAVLGVAAYRKWQLDHKEVRAD